MTHLLNIKRISNEMNYPTMEWALGFLFMGGLTLLLGASNFKRFLRTISIRLNCLCKFYCFVKKMTEKREYDM